MWLSANQISRLVRAKTVVIEPFDEQLLKPASYVLRLGSECLLWRNLSLDIQLTEFRTNEKHFERLPTEKVILHQDSLVLASSFELFVFPMT